MALRKLPAPLAGRDGVDLQASGLKPRAGMPVPFRDKDSEPLTESKFRAPYRIKIRNPFQGIKIQSP